MTVKLTRRRERRGKMGGGGGAAGVRGGGRVGDGGVKNKAKAKEHEGLFFFSFFF